MIKINLLGQPKAKKGPATTLGMPAFGGGGGEGPNFTVIAAALVLLTLGGNYFWYHMLDKEAQTLQKEMTATEREYQELLPYKARVEQKQKLVDSYKRRVDVIDQLRANQAGPVNLLNKIGDTVNQTEAVWLTTMKDEGNFINLEGMALSTHAVANLITNLEKTGEFRSVEIRETIQDNNVKDMQAFGFTVACEKKKS